MSRDDSSLAARQFFEDDRARADYLERESADARRSREEALGDLGGEMRLGERRARRALGLASIGAAAAAALVLILLSDPRTTEDRLAGFELADSFPMDPASVDFDAFVLVDRVRDVPDSGARGPLPAATVATARPRIEWSTPVIDGASEVHVALTHESGWTPIDGVQRVVVAAGRAGFEPSVDLREGLYAVQVTDAGPAADWREAWTFTVVGAEQVRAWLSALPRTGDAQLDRQIEIAELLDRGCAQEALERLRREALGHDESLRRRSILLEARASAMLGDLARVEELRARTEALGED